MARARSKAQGKTMTFVKRENYTVVKCFETEFRQSVHGILFRHFSLVTAVMNVTFSLV